MYRTELTGHLITKEDGTVELYMTGREQKVEPEPTPDPKPRQELFFPGFVHSNSSGSYQSFSADGKYIAIRNVETNGWYVVDLENGEKKFVGSVSANGAVMGHFMWSGQGSDYWWLNRNTISLTTLDGFVTKSYNLPTINRTGFHWRAGTGGGAHTQFAFGWNPNEAEGQHHLQSFSTAGLDSYFEFNSDRTYPQPFTTATRFHNTFLRRGYGYAGPFAFTDSRQTYHHLVGWDGKYIGMLEDSTQYRISHPAWDGNRVIFFDHTTGYTSVIIREYDKDSKTHTQLTYIDQQELQKAMGLKDTFIAGGHFDYRGGKAVMSVWDYKGENRPFSLLVLNERGGLSVAKSGIIKDGDEFRHSLLPSISPTGDWVAYHDDNGVRVVPI